MTENTGILNVELLDIEELEAKIRPVRVKREEFRSTGRSHGLAEASHGQREIEGRCVVVRGAVGGPGSLLECPRLRDFEEPEFVAEVHIDRARTELHFEVWFWCDLDSSILEGFFDVSVRKYHGFLS